MRIVGIGGCSWLCPGLRVVSDATELVGGGEARYSKLDDFARNQSGRGSMDSEGSLIYLFEQPRLEDVILMDDRQEVIKVMWSKPEAERTHFRIATAT